MDEPDDDDIPILAFADKLDGFKPVRGVVEEKKRDWENPNLCEHRGLIVDRKLRTVECKQCGAKIDPYEAIFLVAKQYGEIEWKIEALKQYRLKDRAKREKEAAKREAKKAKPVDVAKEAARKAEEERRQLAAAAEMYEQRAAECRKRLEKMA